MKVHSVTCDRHALSLGGGVDMVHQSDPLLLGDPVMIQNRQRL